jgi:hypothetical protein
VSCEGHTFPDQIQGVSSGEVHVANKTIQARVLLDFRDEVGWESEQANTCPQYQSLKLKELL